MADLSALPGGTLIAEGLDEVVAGQPVKAGYLVAMAATRLRQLGLPVPEVVPTDARFRLYEQLCAEEGDDAHSAYLALVRRLVSFVHALEAEDPAGV
jgi:hypothetical protein